MNAIIFLALVGFATCYTQGLWGPGAPALYFYPYGAGNQFVGGYQYPGPQSLAQWTVQNTLQGGSASNYVNPAQAANQIVQAAEQDQQAQIQNAILNTWAAAGWNSYFPQGFYQKFQQNQPSQGVVAQELKKVQQKQAQPGSVGQQLQQTLQTGIQAQAAVQNAQNNQPEQSGTDQANTDQFQAEVQQLVDQTNSQQTQQAIAQAEHKANQFQLQRQFVHQQKQQVQAQAKVAAQFGAPQGQYQQLQAVKAQLDQQEQHLAKQQIVQLLVVQQLQQVLIDQENQVQHDIADQQVFQNAPQTSVWDNMNVKLYSS